VCTGTLVQCAATVRELPSVEPLPLSRLPRLPLPSPELFLLASHIWFAKKEEELPRFRSGVLRRPPRRVQ